MPILGRPTPRREDHRFLTGAGRFLESFPLEDALTVTFVRSFLAHARLAAVDGSAATESGAQVLTSADIDVASLPQPVLGVKRGMRRPLVAADVVRFVGEIVAVVLSETREAGADAAELVAVEYEPLPVVVDPRDAEDDHVLLFPDAGTNVAVQFGSPEHDKTLFDGCDVVVSGTHLSQRLAPCPLEPRSAAARVEADGRLTAWLTTQTPHEDRLLLARLLRLDPARVRVINRDVGGSFGAKLLGVEEVLVAWLALRLGRTVRWTETRSESMVALSHGRGQRLEFKLGGTRDGKLLAYRLDILADAGAYPGIGAALPGLTALMASGAYAIQRVEVEARSVVTNTTPTTRLRGAGRPEAAQAIERAVDLFALEAGLDPVAVRVANFIEPTAFPYTTATGITYDSGDYPAALELALSRIDLVGLRLEQGRRRARDEPFQLGIGLATYVEITNPLAETEYAEVELTDTGTAIARVGSFAHGQGHETAFAMLVAEALGLPLDDVAVLEGDTDLVPRGTGTFGSKSMQIGGTAVYLAATEVAKRARLMARELGVWATGSHDAPVFWRELTRAAAAGGRLGELRIAREFEGKPTFGFGAHVAVVEIDVETGNVELLRLVAVDDGGNLVNPSLAEGQVHGGLALGAGQALYEAVVFDDDGTPLTTTFAGYSFPSAVDMPAFEVVSLETSTPLNPLGLKGIGEAGAIGSTPAVHNAVVDALAPYGVRHVDLPASGENVWLALEKARA